MARIRRARARARELLARFAVDGPPVDLVAIARALNARIEYSNALGDNVSGVLVPLPNNAWVIGVNAQQPLARKRFTIAHEIAHLVLHDVRAPHADGSFQLRRRDERSADGTIDEEIEANQFAAELLMPAEILLRELHSTPIEYAARENAAYERSVRSLARRFRVSEQSLTLRLSNLGVL